MISQKSGVLMGNGWGWLDQSHEIDKQWERDSIGITDAMSLMLPYTIVFSILWLLILIGFYIIGLPIGVGTGVML